MSTGRTLKVLVLTLLCVLLINFSSTPQSVKAIDTTLTPSDDDAKILGYYADTNYGSSTDLTVRSGEISPKFEVTRSLVKFDLSSIPTDATISSAELRLYYYEYDTGVNNPVGRVYRVYRVISNWDESLVTWNSPWSTAGGDWTTEDYSSSTVPSSFGTMTWDVTDIVQDWIDGENNYGFIIRDPNDLTLDGNEAAAKFYSKEATSLGAGHKPELFIQWDWDLPDLRFYLENPDIVDNTLYIQRTRAPVGVVFAIEVWVRNIPTDWSMTAFDFTVHWDTNQVEVRNVATNVPVGWGKAENGGDIDDDFYYLSAWANNGGVSKDRNVAILTFQCLVEGESTIEVVSGTNFNDGSITIERVTGEIKVVDPEPFSITCNQYIPPRFSVSHDNPVGGVIVPVNKLVILAPFLMIMGSVSLLGFYILKRRRNN